MSVDAVGNGPDLVAAFSQRVSLSPNAPYVSAVGEDGDLHTMTFSEVWQAGLATAEALRCAGIRAGGLIALVTASDLAGVVALWGALAGGSGVLMLDPAWSPRQRAQIAGGCGAVLVEDVRTLSVPTGPIGPAVLGDPEATALVFNTSGSTGMPKAVALPHSALLANANSFRSHHGLDARTRLLTPLPLHHSNAVNTALISPLVTGGHSVLVPPSSLLDLPRWIATTEPSIVSAVPSVLDALLTLWRGRSLPSSLRYVLSAAAPLSRATAAALLDRLELRVVQAYGLTETVNFSTTMPIDLSPAAYRELVLGVPVPSVGIALKDVGLSICDKNGDPVPDGEVGEVQIRGPALMSGYLGDLEATREVLRDGVFRTGDLGRLEHRPGIGSLLSLTGRLKNVAKVRGEQVSCEEVEHILRTVSGVEDAGCVIVPDARDGERLEAAIVSRQDGVVESIFAELRTSWPARMMPRSIVLVEEIPRTTTGKLRRDELHLVIRER